MAVTCPEQIELLTKALEKAFAENATLRKELEACTFLADDRAKLIRSLRSEKDESWAAQSDMRERFGAYPRESMFKFVKRLAERK